MISRFNSAYLFFSGLSITIILLAKISPAYFWGFGLLAFLIPFILAVHIAGLLSFSIIRNRVLFSSLVVLAIGINYIKYSVGFGQISKNADPKPGKSLSILTHNLGSYSFDSEPTNHHYSQMNFRQYDVICFQEFVKSNVDSTIQHFKKKADIEDYNFVFTGKKMTPRNLGLITFSRYPIVNSGKIEFGFNSFNGVNYVDIKVHSDTIRVYNAHFKSYNLKEAVSWVNFIQRIRSAIIERTVRTQEVLAHISKAEHPVILAGDLNEHPYGYVYNQFINNLNDAISSTAYILPQTISDFPVRIDYILVDKKMHVSDFGILNNVLISDHYPIYSLVEY